MPMQSVRYLTHARFVPKLHAQKSQTSDNALICTWSQFRPYVGPSAKSPIWLLRVHFPDHATDMRAATTSCELGLCTIKACVTPTFRLLTEETASWVHGYLLTSDQAWLPPARADRGIVAHIKCARGSHNCTTWSQRIPSMCVRA